MHKNVSIGVGVPGSYSAARLKAFRQVCAVILIRWIGRPPQEFCFPEMDTFLAWSQSFRGLTLTNEALQDLSDEVTGQSSGRLRLERLSDQEVQEHFAVERLREGAVAFVKVVETGFQHSGYMHLYTNPPTVRIMLVQHLCPVHAVKIS